MSSNTPDWDARAPEIQKDQRAAYDKMRDKCPVAYDDYLGYTLDRKSTRLNSSHW